jgi:hypothetical protein
VAKSWEDVLCYSTPSYEEHEVNGKMQKFYPISVGLIFEFRRTGARVVKAVSDLFVNIGHDHRTNDKLTRAGGGEERTITLEPVSLEIAEFRDKQRAEAWVTAFQAVTDKETINLLFQVVMDSMADAFPKDAQGKFTADAPTPEELAAKTKLPTLVQMVVGTAKANKDVFGPLAQTVSSFLARLGKLASSKLGEPTAADKDSKAA